MIKRIVFWTAVTILAIVAAISLWDHFGPYLSGEQPHTVTTDGR